MLQIRQYSHDFAPPALPPNCSQYSQSIVRLRKRPWQWLQSRYLSNDEGWTPGPYFPLGMSVQGQRRAWRVRGRDCPEGQAARPADFLSMELFRKTVFRRDGQK